MLDQAYQFIYHVLVSLKIKKMSSMPDKFINGGQSTTCVI